MPIFRTATKLVLYAHVPKCGGSAVSWYLAERFGQVAFNDIDHTRQPPIARWSRSSPQHIDRDSLGRLFPDGFFDAAFTIVRHPVPRLISAYHFQIEMERSLSEQISFSDWLMDLEERRAEDPFCFDNHVRPMSDFVPEGADVFHMEHGLDALVVWFDALTGDTAAPRAIPRVNDRSQRDRSTDRVTPDDRDLELIARLYGVDFDRFGYSLDSRDPATPAPVLSATQLAERNAALKAHDRPLSRLTRRLRRRIGA